MSSPFLLNLISVDIDSKSNLTGQITCQYAKSRHSAYTRDPYLGSLYSGTIFITYFGHTEYYADPVTHFACTEFVLRVCAQVVPRQITGRIHLTPVTGTLNNII